MLPPLNNTVMIGLVSVAATVVSTTGTYITAMIVGPEHRMTVLEVNQAAHEKQDDQWRSDIRDFRSQLDTKLDRMESKIDRLSEREVRQRAPYAGQAQSENTRDYLRGGK